MRVVARVSVLAFFVRKGLMITEENLLEFPLMNEVIGKAIIRYSQQEEQVDKGRDFTR